eukprot:TRINITY_DN11139_c0_g2_i1.p1 TRINITY_DN11139_c0_g2~~TRINITY_DN11139_c0_g2_i1.p1  ORF type:complete len:283 (+),score=46.46 TRINITY_DN11139_c0_g2_i1:61-909(+)
MSAFSNSQQESHYVFQSWTESSECSSLVFNTISTLPLVTDSRSSLPLVTDSRSSLPELEKHSDFVHNANDVVDKEHESLELAATKLREALELAEVAAEAFARHTRSQGSVNHAERVHKFIAVARALKTSAEIHVSSGTQSYQEAAIPHGTSAPTLKADYLNTHAIGAKRNIDKAARAFDAGSELIQHCAPQNVPRTLVVEGITQLGIDSLGRLRRHFERYGKVASVVEPQLQSFSGLAYVVMQTEIGAKAALRRGEEQRIKDVSIRVSSVTCFASNVSTATD